MCYSKLGMVESAYEAKFYKGDFANVDRPGVRIVLRHNSTNHYAPIVVLSKEEYANWQLKLAKIGKSFLNVVHEVDDIYQRSKSIILV